MPPTDTLRLLVACTMKSGSTYVARALADYFGIEKAEPLIYWEGASKTSTPGMSGSA